MSKESDQLKDVDMQIELLKSGIESQNMHDVLNANEKLIKIGGPAVGPLVELLGDENQTVHVYTLQTLLNIVNRETMGPLVTAVKDNDNPLIRTGATWLLMQVNSPEVDKLLWEKFEEKDWEVISQGSWFFISQAREGSEEILIKALKFTQSKRLVSDFLATGNPSLIKAAREWIDRHPNVQLERQAGAPFWGAAPMAYPWYKRNSS